MHHTARCKAWASYLAAGGVGERERDTMITKAWRLIRTAHVTYGGVTRHTLGILCLLCDAVSYSPVDIAERYCGRCHTWLADVDRYHVRADEVIGEAAPVAGEGQP